jgi:hypothetical protein
MGIYEHTTEFAGLPVKDWEPGMEIVDPSATLYRVSVSWEEGESGKRWTEKLAEFLGFKRRAPEPAAPRPTQLDSLLADPAAAQLPGLVIGPWEEVATGTGNHSAVEALIAAREHLPALRALFLGDITQEESEISWIQQSDVTPLLHAYPALEHFCVRGGEGLSFRSLRHERLKSLIVQTGGLSVEVVREICAAHLPALEHLELWLGVDDYGGNTEIADLEPILSGRLFPKLTYLGLRDSENADAIAAAVATAPVTERIRLLDLSLGTLGDEGAAALLASPAVARLEKLDIHHHYCSEEVVQRLEALGITVDASERQEPEDYDGRAHRYVAVSE